MDQRKFGSGLKAIALNSDRATARVFWIVSFAILTAMGAQLEIPHSPVPFTAQTLFVLLAGGLLGARDGALSMLAYLLLGSLGLPVFSGLSAGVGRVFGPTGGYLLAFPAAAFAIGWLMQGSRSPLRITLSMVAGLSVIFLCGVSYLNVFYVHDWTQSWQGGGMIFSWWDLVKLAAASSVTTQLRRRSA